MRGGSFPPACQAARKPATESRSAAARSNSQAEVDLQVAVGETVILMTPPFIPIETPTKGRGGVQQNDSLADGYLQASGWTTTWLLWSMAQTCSPGWAISSVSHCIGSAGAAVAAARGWAAGGGGAAHGTARLSTLWRRRGAHAGARPAWQGFFYSSHFRCRRGCAECPAQLQPVPGAAAASAGTCRPAPEGRAALGRVGQGDPGTRRHRDRPEMRDRGALMMPPAASSRLD